MADRRVLWWSLGLTALGLGAAGMAYAWTRPLEPDEVGRIREELFEVGPNCETILLRGPYQDASEQEVKAFLSQADQRYFDPEIRKLASENIRDSQQVTIQILDQLFPECRGEWPPEPLGHVSKSLLWIALWSHIDERMTALGVERA